MRMSCIYGPRQFGTEDQGWLAHFMRLALRHAAITIFGDGFQVRDALHVSDAVAAWLAALEHIEEVSGRVFNLGGGPANTTSLLELIDEIGEMLGHQPILRFAEWRPGDQPWYVSNLAAVTSALDWAPRTPLRQGLVSLRQWLEHRFGAQAGQEVHA
jgi:CDP-paratose 2-epimerase